MLQPPKLRAPLYSRHIKTEKKSNKDPLFGSDMSGTEEFHCSTVYHTVVHQTERTGLQALEMNVSLSDNQEICVIMQHSVLVPRVPYFVPAFTSDGRAVACLYFEL